jgi:hypothetical protein
LSDLEKGDLGGPANQGFRDAYAAAERAAAQEAGLLEEEAPAEAETPVAVEDASPVEAEAPETADERDARIEDLEARLCGEGRVHRPADHRDRRTPTDRRSRFTELDNRVNQPQQFVRQITPETRT